MEHSLFFLQKLKCKIWKSPLNLLEEVSVSHYRSAQIHSLNWQLWQSHPQKNTVFSKVYLSLHLLRTFLYKEIKDNQNLEGVWTDISTPNTILLRMKQKFSRKIPARRKCSFSASHLFYSSIKQANPCYSLQWRRERSLADE